MVRGAPIDAETVADRKNNPFVGGWESRADIGSDMRISPSEGWMMSNRAMGGSTDPLAMAAEDAAVADRIRKSIADSPDVGIMGPGMAQGGADPLDQELQALFGIDFTGNYTGGVDPSWLSYMKNAPGAKQVHPFQKGYMTNSPYTLDFFDTKLGQGPVGQFYDQNRGWINPVGKAILTGLTMGPQAGLYSLGKSGWNAAMDMAENKYGNNAAVKIGNLLPKLLSIYTGVGGAAAAGR